MADPERLSLRNQQAQIDALAVRITALEASQAAQDVTLGDHETRIDALEQP